MMYCNVFAATKVKIVDDIRVNGMLALRLTDMSNRRMENINALDNPEEINKNFRILADRLSKQEKQLKAFLERSKDDE